MSEFENKFKEMFCNTKVEDPEKAMKTINEELNKKLDIFAEQFNKFLQACNHD